MGGKVEFIMMNKLIDKVGNVIQKIIWILLVGVMGLLAILNILGTTRIDTKLNGYHEYANYNIEIIFIVLSYLVLFFVVIFIIDQRIGIEKIKTSKIMKIALIYVVAVGVFYILITRGKPINDQFIVQSEAAKFLQGDYQALKKGGYLASYPQQLGIISIFQIIYGIFGKENYTVIMLINVLCVAGIFYFLYKILTKMTDKVKIHNLYWIMVFGAFPIIFYSFFVYGTIIGLLFALIGFYYLLKFKDKPKVHYYIITFISLALSAICKSNYLICVIAAVLVLLFYAIREKKGVFILLSLVLALSLMAPKAINLYYEKKSGIEVQSGVPATCFIAMGLQKGDKKSACGADGWYNGYNLGTYNGAGGDSEKADRIAKENINKRVAEFKKSPIEFLSFAKNKITTQYCEPTFQVFWMAGVTNNHDEWSGVAKQVHTGFINVLLQIIMKIYLVLIWLGNLIYLIARRKKLTIWNMMIPIAVLGGFVFHFLWEGKALYIMPYYAISFVAGVQGVYFLYEKIKTVIKKETNREKSEVCNGKDKTNL